GVEAVESGFAAEVEGFAGDGGGGHKAVGELVFGEDVELAAGVDDVEFAFFAARVEVAIGEDGGGGAGAGFSGAPGPNDVARFGIETGGNAAVVDGEEQAVGESDAGFVGCGFLQPPDEVGGGEGAMAAEFEGEESGLAKARRDVDQAVADHRSRGRTV